MERTKKNEIPKEKEEIPEVTKNENPETPEETEVIKEEKSTPKVKNVPDFVDPDPVIRWRKVGGGSLRLPKRLIKPNEIFSARVSDIPKAFRDTVIPLEQLPDLPEPEYVPPVKSVYKVVPRGKSKVYFDIVGPSGKALNEKMLTKAEAERLKADLER